MILLVNGEPLRVERVNNMESQKPFSSYECQMALIDFTLSNARRFYLSMGNPLGWKGLNENPFTIINTCYLIPDSGFLS